jgi:hypothetical protein
MLLMSNATGERPETRSEERMKSKTTQARGSNTLAPFVRLGRGLEYPLIIQRGRGRNAEFIAGVHFADKPTRRELRQWRDAIQRGMEPNAALTGLSG